MACRASVTTAPTVTTEDTMARAIGRIARLATQYEDQSEQLEDDTTSFEVPEDLSTLSDDDLAALHAQAVDHFDSLYGDGSHLSDERGTTLQALPERIVVPNPEVAVRAQH